MTTDRPQRLVALTGDLMDRSKISAAAVANGLDVKAVSPSPTAVAALDLDGVVLVVVDLSRPSSLDATRLVRERLPDVRIIAFGPHVVAERLQAATAAGCDEALPRSKFFGSIDVLLLPPAH
jgi:DNA-binding NarL/FixJ family response regulator